MAVLTFRIVTSFEPGHLPLAQSGSSRALLQAAARTFNAHGPDPMSPDIAESEKRFKSLLIDVTDQLLII